MPFVDVLVADRWTYNLIRESDWLDGYPRGLGWGRPASSIGGIGHHFVKILGRRERIDDWWHISQIWGTRHQHVRPSSGDAGRFCGRQPFRSCSR